MDEQTNTPQEVDEPKTPQPVDIDPPEETVGDIMEKMDGEGLKSIVILGGIIVYTAVVVYAEVHGFSLLKQGLAPDMQFWAGAGMVGAGITALLFPIARKVWTIESKHRRAAGIFYAMDFVFLAFNAVVGFTTTIGGTIPPWLVGYKEYFLPASPIIIGAMWAILFELDPNTREKVQRLTLRMAMKQKMSKQVAEAAKGAHVTARVNAAADREVERALTELFGYPVTRGYVMDTTERTRDSLAARFFGWALKQGQSLASYVMGGPSQPSDSSQQDEPKP